MLDYKEKYFKYKTKYLNLKGGRIMKGGRIYYDNQRGEWLAGSKGESQSLNIGEIC